MVGLPFGVAPLLAVTSHLVDGHAVIARRTQRRNLHRRHAQLALREPLTRGIAFAMNFGLCPLAAVTAYSAWRLIEFYKRGDFFNPAAARWLCRATSLALAGNLYWNVVHPLTIGLFAQGVDAPWATVRWGDVWSVDELLKTVLFLALFALARVQAAGVDLAREHAQIV